MIQTAMVSTSHKLMAPGTTGWTVADLDDPAVESQWLDGRYEIVEGVLTVMPPAFFSGGEAVFNLVFQVESQLRDRGPTGGAFSPEVDIVISPHRVVRADFAYLTREQKRRQSVAAVADGRLDPRRSRILIPPLLIIESRSSGHEAHDRQTKRQWYAEFGVAHYWLLDVFDRSVECLRLDGATYVVDCAGRGSDILRPACFPSVAVRLSDVWPDDE
jgi:Uma2 family endonuclease